MTAHDEPTSLESVARTLLLARQDIEAMLANEPAWQAMRHLAATSGGTSTRERELVEARLALVPAYRALKRINEALHGLAMFVAGQSAWRGNNWAGGLSADMPSLQQAAQEFAAHGGAASEGQLLSGWQSKADVGCGATAIERPAVDLERLINLVRRGTKERGPQPLDGLLAGAESIALPKPTAADDRRLVFPETIPDPHPGIGRVSDEPIELVPVRDARAATTEADAEIIVDDSVSSSDPVAIPIQATTADEEPVVDIGEPRHRGEADAVVSAATSVRRFISAWSDRSKG